MVSMVVDVDTTINLSPDTIMTLLSGKKILDFHDIHELCTICSILDQVMINTVNAEKVVKHAH